MVTRIVELAIYGLVGIGEQPGINISEVRLLGAEFEHQVQIAVAIDIPQAALGHVGPGEQNGAEIDRAALKVGVV